MRESFERAKGRLRRALGLPKSAKALPSTDSYGTVQEALTTDPATEPTTRAQTSLLTYSTDPGSQLEPGLTRKLRTRMSNRHSLYNLFHNPPLLSKTSTDDTGTNCKPTTVHRTFQSNPIFLSLPAEIRNQIYRLLLPDSTNLRDVTGIICACRQIRRELSSMIVAETKPIMEDVKRLSVIRRQTDNPAARADPFIHTPTVSTYTLLCNISLSLPMTSNQLPAGKKSSVTLINAFSDLKALLRLHLPYVTISVPIMLGGNEYLSDPWIRHRFLNDCYKAFRRLEETHKYHINAQHVIFELGKDEWENQTWAYPPVIAFVKHQDADGAVGFEFMGHDPRSELPNYEDVEWDSVGVDELTAVLKKSREAALAKG